MTQELLEEPLPLHGGWSGLPGPEAVGVSSRATAGPSMTFGVEPHESLRTAAQRMIDQDLTCLVVVASGGPRGLLLDRGLVSGVVCAQLDGAEPVEAVPWHPFVAAREGRRASEAAWLMESQALRHVPVTDETGCIVGVLAIEDALALVLDELTALAAGTRRSAAATGPANGLRSDMLLRAKDVQTLVPSVDADVPARAVAEHLCATASDALVVVEGARPSGIVCKRNLVERFVAGGADPACVRADDLVERPFASVSPEDPLEEVLAQVARTGVRHVAVTSDRGGLGIVSLRDLLSRLVLELAARLPPLPV